MSRKCYFAHVILIYELDLKVLTVYLHTKMNFVGQGFEFKLEHYEWTDRQTDRCDRKDYHAAFAGDNNNYYGMRKLIHTSIIQSSDINVKACGCDSLYRIITKFSLLPF